MKNQKGKNDLSSKPVPLCIYKIFLVMGIALGSATFVLAQQSLHEKKDFNHDGETDSLGWQYDGGSGFGGIYCALRNGKTKELYEMDGFACFCRIKKTVLIPPALQRAENKPFLDAIIHRMLPPLRNAPDPSLQWIIAASFSRKDSLQSIYFDLVFSGPPGWLHGSCILPDAYALRTGGDTLARLYSTDSDIPGWYTPGTTPGYISYSGLQQRDLFHSPPLLITSRAADSNSTYKLYCTSHAVWVQKGNQYKWLFITDTDINDAPDKLRWPSMAYVQLLGDMALIVQQVPTQTANHVYLVDIESGKCGRIRYDLQLPEGRDIPSLLQFDAVNKQLYFTADGRGIIFDLQAMQKELAELP